MEEEFCVGEIHGGSHLASWDGAPSWHNSLKVSGSGGEALKAREVGEV